MKIEHFENVWDALESDPVRRARLKLRSQLMEALRGKVGRWRTGRNTAARRLKIAPSRLDKLMEGRFTAFSLGALFDLATRAGLKIKLSIDDARAKPKTKKAA